MADQGQGLHAVQVKHAGGRADGGAVTVGQAVADASGAVGHAVEVVVDVVVVVAVVNRVRRDFVVGSRDAADSGVLEWGQVIGRRAVRQAGKVVEEADADAAGFRRGVG